jgi:hypothetical protein
VLRRTPLYTASADTKKKQMTAEPEQSATDANIQQVQGIAASSPEGLLHTSDLGPGSSQHDDLPPIETGELVTEPNQVYSGDNSGPLQPPKAPPAEGIEELTHGPPVTDDSTAIGDALPNAISSPGNSFPPTSAPGSGIQVGEHLELRNFVEEMAYPRVLRLGRPMADIFADLQQLTGGWPRRVGNKLFITNASYEVVGLDSVSSLFAWLRTLAKVVWASGPDPVPPGQFFSFLQMNATAYDAIEPFPHFPPVNGVFYSHPPLPAGNGTALNHLLSGFAPATAVDAQLLRAFVLTLFWGGPAGQRPAWLLTGPENDPLGGIGVGKSICVQLVGDLVDGCFEVLPGEDMATIKKRLLSPGARHLRLARIDNVKEARLDWADLDSLLTAPTISGHRLYAGEGRRPNYIVWALTINHPAVSRDLARRCIVIRLARPTNTTTWLGDMRTFIAENHWQIIADVGHALIP